MRTTITTLSTLLLASLATACGGGQTVAGGANAPAATPAGTAAATAAQSGTQAATPPAAPPPPAGHPDPNLIPRKTFFGNPERASVEISHDGKMLSWLAPKDGVLNVWVAPVGKLTEAKAITADTKRPVRNYFWAWDNKHILYQQDSGGDENWHIYSVDVKSGKASDLTPLPKVAARVEALSVRHPGEVLIGLNDRNPQLHDVYKVDIATGKRTEVLENPGFAGFTYDENLNVRLGTLMSPDGGFVVETPPAKDKARTDLKAWKEFMKIPADDALTTQPLGFDRSGHTLYLLDSRGRDTAALASMPARGGKAKILAEDARADAGGVLMHPTRDTPEAVSFTYERTEWKPLDRRIGADFARLHKLAQSGEFAITSGTKDDNTWVVVTYSDAGPARYYVWDRRHKKERFLFTNRPALEKLELAHMHPEVIPARDGLKLVSYLTLPTRTDANADGRPDAPQPMVLLVHGGPWARDSWGYNPLHQLLANRGYAVLSVNYRGSTGFGKKFINAGNHEWAGKMHDDLIDAVKWATDNKIADARRVCIMGGSYGGYATLVGLSFTPDEFACGVDIVGPSNLITLLHTIPPYWKPVIDMFKTRVGDWTTDAGKKELLARSPISRVDAIKVPLLIGQGANDPRVNQAESDRIVKALQGKRVPVTYVLFPDEGHGFARPENNLAFFAVSEAFLSAYLGGTFQPLEASSLQGSSITVPYGAAAVPELSAALAGQQK